MISDNALTFLSLMCNVSTTVLCIKNALPSAPESFDEAG